MFLKNMIVVLVTIHNQKYQISVLLVASDKDLKVADCLVMGVNGERD
jgi:hypothetical protein